jgi:hypothetical protein
MIKSLGAWAESHTGSGGCGSLDARFGVAALVIHTDVAVVSFRPRSRKFYLVYKKLI